MYQKKLNNTPFKSEEIISENESDYLYIDASQISIAGNGLYTAIDIFKDEVIAYFKGEILTQLQVQRRADKNKDQYFIAMLDGKIMDSKNINCFAKYANDANACKNYSYKNNAKITIDEYNNVCLIATKKIKSNQEIFCAYGKKYWQKHGVI
jgi:uncharacterized protein